MSKTEAYKAKAIYWGYRLLALICISIIIWTFSRYPQVWLFILPSFIGKNLIYCNDFIIAWVKFYHFPLSRQLDVMVTACLLLSIFISVYLFFPVSRFFYDRSISLTFRYYFCFNSMVAFWFFYRAVSAIRKHEAFYNPVYVFDVYFDFNIFTLFVYAFGSLFFLVFGLFYVPSRVSDDKRNWELSSLFLQNKKLYYNLWLLFVIYVVLVFLTTVRNFYVLFFFVELLSFLIILLLMNSSDYLRHTWAVMQYFVFACLSTTIFVFFLLRLSVLCPDLSYASVLNYINHTNDYSPYYLLGIVFVFLFKLGFAPMHHVLIDVYSNLPFYVFSFLVAFYKFVIFSLIVIIYKNIYVSVGFNFLFFVSFCSIFFGSLGVVSALSLRKILLFGSLFTSGVCLLLVSIHYWYFALVYFIVYSIFSFLLTTVFILQELSLQNKPLFFINELTTLNGWSLASVLLSLVTLVGLPPLPLFWMKISFYSLLLEKLGFLFVGLLLFFFAAAIFGYLKIIFFLVYSYFKKPKPLLTVDLIVFKDPWAFNVIRNEYMYYNIPLVQFTLIFFIFILYFLLHLDHIALVMSDFSVYSEYLIKTIPKHLNRAEDPVFFRYNPINNVRFFPFTDPIVVRFDPINKARFFPFTDPALISQWNGNISCFGENCPIK